MRALIKASQELHCDELLLLNDRVNRTERFKWSDAECTIRLMPLYRYFIQEWGYQAWNHADQSTITLQHVHNATPKVVSRLDANFFHVRFGPNLSKKG